MTDAFVERKPFGQSRPIRWAGGLDPAAWEPALPMGQRRDANQGRLASILERVSAFAGYQSLFRSRAAPPSASKCRVGGRAALLVCWEGGDYCVLFSRVLCAPQEGPKKGSAERWPPALPVRGRSSLVSSFVSAILSLIPRLWPLIARSLCPLRYCCGARSARTRTKYRAAARSRPV